MNEREYTALGEDARREVAAALRRAADAIESSAVRVSGGIRIDVEGDVLIIDSDLRLSLD